ncbi:MAG: heme biosynthesis HemY N-terminal domain-containing protein [Hyphomicrobiaceae bacterium]
MLRLVVYFLIVAGLAAVLSWLADNPGSIVINWQGYIWDTNVFQMAIILSVLAAMIVLLWTALRGIWQSPAAIGSFFNRRREKRGLEALSSGMIAIGAGDRSLATRYAIQARKSLPNEPMTHLLRAQAAQLVGDRPTSRRIFEAMLASPDTEALGLRGLFLEAEREGEKEAARQFAERAVRLNPKLSWPVDALFDIQCRSGDWDSALDTLAVARKHGHVEKTAADRRRAVLLAGQAQECEDNDPERAMTLALESHKLAPDLVAAAAVAGRVLAARGSTPRATKILQQTWRKSQHPDLAVAYAYARLGDSPRDRLQRVTQLAALTPNVIESPVAVANAAIEARAFDVARAALEPLTEGRLTQRVCTLMARIEGEQHGNAGGVREWLARAVNAPRDPAWTADGIVSDKWLPVSPVSGALDAFQWRVPVEAAEPRDKELLAQKIEELVKLGVSPETMLGGSGAVVADGLGGSHPVDSDDANKMPVPAGDAGHATDLEAVDVEAVEVKPSEVKLGEVKPGDATETGDRKQPSVEPAASPARSVGPVTAPGAVAAEAAAATDQTSQTEPTAPDRQAAAKVQGQQSSSAPPVETKIFVSPRAPDDPGPPEGANPPSKPLRDALGRYQPVKS